MKGGLQFFSNIREYSHLQVDKNCHTVNIFKYLFPSVRCVYGRTWSICLVNTRSIFQIQVMSVTEWKFADFPRKVWSRYILATWFFNELGRCYTLFPALLLLCCVNITRVNVKLKHESEKGSGFSILKFT